MKDFIKNNLIIIIAIGLIALISLSMYIIFQSKKETALSLLVITTRYPEFEYFVDNERVEFILIEGGLYEVRLEIEPGDHKIESHFNNKTIYSKDISIFPGSLLEIEIESDNPEFTKAKELEESFTSESPPPNVK